MTGLERLRKENGLSQEDLASIIGLHRYQIADWEQGRCEPSVENLIKLSDFFCVSIEELISSDFLKTGLSSSEFILRQIIK